MFRVSRDGDAIKIKLREGLTQKAHSGVVVSCRPAEGDSNSEWAHRGLQLDGLWARSGAWELGEADGINVITELKCVAL